MIKEFADQKEVQMIVFQLGKEEYAVPITCVQEIIMLQTPTRIPKAPVFVEGVINLRGRIIPIIDSKKKFQLEANDQKNSNESRIIILDVEQEIIGLIVDSVSEVVHLKTEDIEPTPVEMGEDVDSLWGVGKFKNRLLILINPCKFLTSIEAIATGKIAQIAENIANIANAET